MELKDALRTRRAVREFSGEPVDDVAIEEHIEEAVLAPSTVNLQPWAFAVVRGPECGERQSSEGCCLAGENFMLAAQAWLSDPAAKIDLGIPADWHPAST